MRCRTGVVGREISRGALYRTLDRLEEKGFLDQEFEHDLPSRGGHPRWRFRVTAEAMKALRASRKRLTGLWSGLEESCWDECAAALLVDVTWWTATRRSGGHPPG